MLLDSECGLKIITHKQPPNYRHFTLAIVLCYTAMGNYKTLQSFIDEHNDQYDQVTEQDIRQVPNYNSTIEKLSDISSTVSENEIKLLLIAIEEQIHTYLNGNRDNYGVVVDFISIIGKQVGWSVIYILLRTMKKYNDKYYFLCDAELCAFKSSQYTVISYLGANITSEDKILKLIQLKDSESFSGLDFSFSNTELYLNVPQFVGDLEKTIDLDN